MAKSTGAATYSAATTPTYSASSSGGGSYSPYTMAFSNPWGDDPYTHNIREGMGPVEYLPNTAGAQDDQQAWEAGENQADRDLQWGLANLPLDWQKQKYANVDPLMKGILNQKPSMGASAAAPTITQGGVWSDQMVNQQVNQAKANNAQQTATTLKQNQMKTAGQGFGSQSPLLAALNNAAMGAQIGQDATSEQNIRWDAAEGNADMRLQQEAQSSSNWAEAMDQDIRRRQQEYMAQSSLLSALAGYL